MDGIASDISLFPVATGDAFEARRTNPSRNAYNVSTNALTIFETNA
jgi:hypothetical protein